MAATFLDSTVFGGLWKSQALAALFEEQARTAAWLEILAVLAECQAEVSLIPEPAARAVAAACRALPVDAALLEELRAERQASSHSTAGLIRAVVARCPGEAGQWVYYGATVQDLSDTWMMMTLGRARALLASGLAGIDATLTTLAARHRDTAMLGRTHGQAGLPITFGLKVAGWGQEVRRHRVRLREQAPRLDQGQLSGGTGSMAAFGPRALELAERFCHRLGLAAPLLPWTASRDVLCEWGGLLTLVTGTADRIGHEVMNLARSEIGELWEGQAPGVIGSITMPHKRNPESAEHLGTLARLVRHGAAVLAEGLVHDHERDGRAWKAEWQVLPEITLMAGRAVELLAGLLAGLEVHPARMRENLEATSGGALSEPVMLALAPRLGRARAHQLLLRLAGEAAAAGQRFDEAIRGAPEIAAVLPAAALAEALDPARQLGQCGALVDRFVAAADGVRR